MRSVEKIMGPQNCGSPKLENFGTPTWESQNKKPFGCGLRGGTEYTIRGKVMASPKSGSW